MTPVSGSHPKRSDLELGIRPWPAPASVVGDILLTAFTAAPNVFDPHTQSTRLTVDIITGLAGASVPIDIYATTKVNGIPVKTGNPTRTLTVPGLVRSGSYPLDWNGRDANGNVVTGLFLVELRATEVVSPQKTINGTRALEVIGGLRNVAPPCFRGTLRNERGEVPLGAQILLEKETSPGVFEIFQAIQVTEGGAVDKLVLEAGTFRIRGIALRTSLTVRATSPSSRAARSCVTSRSARTTITTASITGRRSRTGRT